MTNPEDFEAVEAQDRELERGDSPATHLYMGPLNRCECGYLPREIAPGHWVCPCDLVWEGA